MKSSILLKKGSEMDVKKVEREWTKLAGGEKVEVKEVGGHFYGFTSRLGALELFHAYRNCNSKQKIGFSQTYDSWYFTMEFKYEGVK